MTDEQRKAAATAKAEKEAAAKAEIQRKLNSQAYRLGNLYYIEDKNGKKVKFRPNWEQKELHNNLHSKNAVLKCRQPGISTYCAILMLDFSLFGSNKTSGVIDKTDDDAKRKLEKIRFAYEHLDDPDDPTTAAIGALIKQTVKLDADNKKELAWSNGSKVWAGTSMRGGTLQFLWITELGYTSFYNPQQAEEIKKGALNTIHAGNRIIVESTHEGGKFGVYYNILKQAMEAIDPLSPMDWRFHFFAWWRHSGYSQEVPLGWTPDKEHAAYFATLAVRGIALTDGQKLWYAKKHAEIGDAILSEFPSTEDEAFEAVVKGAIYGKHITDLRAKKRIVDFEHDRQMPFYTFWDIGYSDFTAIWLVQFCGRDICAVAYRCNCREAPPYYVAIIREWERKYEMAVRTHFLPHDADAKEKSGKSYRDYLREAGMANVQVVIRTPDEWLGINHLRSLLPRFVIHKTECGKPWQHDGREMPSGTQCLEGYHTKEDAGSGVIRENPVHDSTSHACLAKGTFVEMDFGPMEIENVKAGQSVKIGNSFGIVEWAGWMKDAETLSLHLSNGAVLRCTPDHKIFTMNGVMRADQCCIGEELVMHSNQCINHHLKSEKGVRESFSDYIGARDIICGPKEVSTSARLAIAKTFCTCASGLITEVLSRMRWWFIHQEEKMTSLAWSLGKSRTAVGPSNVCISRVWHFTKKPIRSTFALIQWESFSPAKLFTVLFGKPSRDQSPQSGTFTTKTKTPKTTISQIWRSFLLRSIACITQKQISGWEVKKTNGSWRRSQGLESVVRVEFSNHLFPVYDLTVKKHGCYSANGVMVSNCDALRTLAEADMRGLIPGTSGVVATAPRSVVLAGWNAPRAGVQPRRAILN